MPEGLTSIPVSVRIPTDMIETLDKVAAGMDRSRSWVILDAIREYLADEGQEVLDVLEGLAEVERGEVYDAEEILEAMRRKIANAERAAK
jgi:predicted transcriptional regulator